MSIRERKMGRKNGYPEQIRLYAFANSIDLHFRFLHFSMFESTGGESIERAEGMHYKCNLRDMLGHLKRWYQFKQAGDGSAAGN